MDIVIRIIIMIVITIVLPFIAKLISKPFQDKEALEDFKKSNIIEKIGYFIMYFFLNWLIIAPSLIFIECFKYIFIK